MSATPATETLPARRARGRSVVVWTALVVAGLLLLLSSFAVWVNRVALNTGVFTDTSSELLEDETIRVAVATRAVDELFTSVDVEVEIEDQLPENLKSLSGPATAGLREASYRVVERALEQPRLQRLWAAAVESSHATLVDVLEGELGSVSTEGGVVTLDLEEVVLEAADRVGIRSRVEDKLPEDVGRIEVLRSDELDTAQSAFQLLKTLAWVLPLLALAAFGLVVWLSPLRRVGARRIGVTLVAVGVLGVVAVRLVGNYVVDSLVSETESRDAAGNAWGILTELLRASFRWTVVVGVLVLLAAWLAGPARLAVAVRRALAPAVRQRAWPYAALGLLALVLVLSSAVTDFARLLVVALFIGLGALWIETVRAQTAREFPDAAGYPLFAAARERADAWWTAQRATARERRAAREALTRPAAAPPAPPGADTISRLSQLADLHARGDLTDEEFAAAKARVLAGE